MVVSICLNCVEIAQLKFCSFALVHYSLLHNHQGGGTQLFFGGCVPHRFPKVGSREGIFLGTKMCVLRAEILAKTRLKMHFLFFPKN